LSVSHNSAGRIGIDTGEILIITLARSEGTVLGVVGSVVGTTDAIEDVLAEVRGMCTSRVTSLDTESIATHETGMSISFKILGYGGTTNLCHSMTCCKFWALPPKASE
jgi:hypothetical protein